MSVIIPIAPIYFDGYVSSGMVSTLENDVDWVSPQFARKECFMSDIPREYQYIDNGPIYKSIPFHPLVKAIMAKINTGFKSQLNVCFLNYYIDQTKALGWHADDSQPIDQTEPIAVVSLGQPREIWWKPNDFKGAIPPEWRQLLGDGSLFIMPAGMQDTHKHKIPKGDRVMGPRISLTYRAWKKDM